MSDPVQRNNCDVSFSFNIVRRNCYAHGNKIHIATSQISRRTFYKVKHITIYQNWGQIVLNLRSFTPFYPLPQIILVTSNRFRSNCFDNKTWVPLHQMNFSLTCYFNFQYQQPALKLLQHRHVSHYVYFSNMRRNFANFLSPKQDLKYLTNNTTQNLLRIYFSTSCRHFSGGRIFRFLVHY